MKRQTEHSRVRRSVAGMMFFLMLLGGWAPADIFVPGSFTGAGNGWLASAAAAEEGDEEAPTVEIPEEKQQLIGVKIAEVIVRPLTRTIRTVGRVEYDERKLATVNTKFEGWIERLFVDYTGKYVKKGEPLAEIYSPELYATQQEFINTLRWAKRGDGSVAAASDSPYRSMLAEDAALIIDAARKRLKLWDITDEQIQTIEATGVPIRTLTIHSPVSGYVVRKMALQGMRAMPGETLFDIADLSTVWILADIYEYELPLVRAGQKATVVLSYSPGKIFTSVIDYVYPTLAGETRTAKVRLVLPNPGTALKPQMFTNIEMKIDMGRRLAIPKEAVIDTGTRKIVYVDQGDGYFEPRVVVTGHKFDEHIEILRGLWTGERVASSANFLIDSEAQLRGIVPLGGGDQ